MRKWAYIIIGLILVLAGALLLWTPLPVGVPLMLAGLPLLMRFSTTARGIILKQARRYPTLSRRLRRMSRRERG